jgi:DNA gyrase subunit B
MYFGGTDERALNTCVIELVANSVEQHLAKLCSSISVIIQSDGSVSVKDDGPGIPIAIPDKYDAPYLEVAFTTLHALNKPRMIPYRVLGSAGVGAKCVNAVSEWMVVTTVSNGEEFQIAFARGKVNEPLRKCGEPNSKRGTTIQFRPDPEIFGDKTFNSNTLTRSLEQIAMLHPGLDVWFVDERPNSGNRALVSHFLFPNGSADYLNLILPKQTRIDYPQGPVQISGEEAGVKVSVAFQFSESINTLILSFVNSSHSLIGGTHVAGFLRGLTDAVNQFAGNRRQFQPHEVRIGLSAIVSVWLADPKWARAWKAELINPEVEAVVRKFTFEKVRAWIGEIQKSDDWFIERLEEQRSPGFGLE